MLTLEYIVDIASWLWSWWGMFVLEDGWAVLKMREVFMEWAGHGGREHQGCLLGSGLRGIENWLGVLGLGVGLDVC